VVLDNFTTVVNIVVCNPFKTEIIGCLAEFNIIKAPVVNPEDDKKDWTHEYVHDGFPESYIVLNHGLVKNVPFIRNNNFEENTGPEVPVFSSSVSVCISSNCTSLRDVNVEHTVVAS
jgi:hypothetical protein